MQFYCSSPWWHDMREITDEDIARAKRIAQSIAGREDQDAESAAYGGLWEASVKFDGRGTWSGYSGQIVKWRVLNALKRHDPLPVDPWVMAEVEQQTTTGLPPEVDEALAFVPPDVAYLFEAGDIDLRKPEHREGIAIIRERLGVES